MSEDHSKIGQVDPQKDVAEEIEPIPGKDLDSSGRNEETKAEENQEVTFAGVETENQEEDQEPEKKSVSFNVGGESFAKLGSYHSIYGLSKHLSASTWRLDMKNSEVSDYAMDSVEDVIHQYKDKWSNEERAVFLAKLLDTMDLDILQRFSAAVEKKLLKEDFIRAFPEELTEIIINNLTTRERMMASSISKGWRLILREESFWKRLIKDHFGIMIRNPPTSLTNFLNRSVSLKDAFYILARTCNIHTEATGSFHTCFIGTDGSVCGFGRTPEFRRYKLNYSTIEPLYEKIGQDIWPVMIAVGDCHILALSDEGQVFSCGCGEDGCLGMGTTKDQKSFKIVSALTKHRIVYISAGNSHSAAISDRGMLFTWGRGLQGQLGHGDNHALTRPKEVEVPWTCKTTKVSCGEAHTLALNEYGELFACGSSKNGQLGQGSLTQSPIFTKVSSLWPTKVVSISAGGDNSAVITEDGVIYTFGSGTPEPERVSVLERKRINTVAAGKRHFAAIDDKGTLYTWGWGLGGQLGHGTNSEETSPKAVRIGKPVRGVSCGRGHTLAVSIDGEVYAWGENDHGQLGSGNTESLNEPRKLDLKTPVVYSNFILHEYEE